VSKTDFIDAIAAKTGLPKNKVLELHTAFVATINESLQRDGKVRVSGLGTFELKNVPSRTGRNPRTGNPIEIEAGNRVCFRGASALKKSVA